MHREAFLNICATVVAVVGTLVFMEIALRIYNPINQTVKYDKIILRVNYDEVIKNNRISGVGREIHIHTNLLGFRGPEPPADMSDTLSVIAVGGSTTRLTFQSDGNTWVDLLSAEAASCFKNTWFNNAGLDGHSSFGHISLIRDYISKVRPKMVLLLIGANDLYLDQPGAFDREQVREDLSFQLGIKGLLKGLASKSELAALGLTMYRSLRAWSGGQIYQNLKWAELQERDPMPVDGDVQLAAAAGRQSAYADRLRRILTLLRGISSLPVLMTQPSPFGIAKDPTTGKDLSRIEYGLYQFRMIETFNATMREVARAENVKLIDLALAMPKDTKYFYDNWHFTDAGVEKLATVIASELLPYMKQKFSSYFKSTCQMLPAQR